MHSIMVFVNSDGFTSFPIWISFISFSSLIAIARTSKTMLNNTHESGHPCLVPDLWGTGFSFLPLNNAYCGFVLYGLYYGEVGSFYAHFFKSFYYKCMLNFVKSLFFICWDYRMDFTFQFVNMVYYLDWFAILKKLGYTQLDHGVWSFQCVVGFSLLEFCRTFASVFISDTGL